MTCRDFEADVVDLARGVEIDAAAAALLGPHLEQCVGCSARLARERELTAGLRAMSAAEPQSARAQAIEAELLAAFGAPRPAAAPQLPSPRPMPGRLNVRTWFAAAAVLVLAVAAWQFAARRPWPGGPAAGIDTARARAAASPAPEPAPQDGGQEMPFVALPTAIGLPALESGRIVRVELPAAELPAYGFVLEPQPAGGAVEADVLVGQDGEPRAIRFVTVEADSRRPQ
jgi:hypothetical protein